MEAITWCTSLEAGSHDHDQSHWSSLVMSSDTPLCLTGLLKAGGSSNISLNWGQVYGKTGVQLLGLDPTHLKISRNFFFPPHNFSQILSIFCNVKYLAFLPVHGK